jgi:hypothetical protein
VPFSRKDAKPQSIAYTNTENVRENGNKKDGTIQPVDCFVPSK